jgi:hypothetical protein
VKFKSIEWFKISGRGWVCSVTFDEEFYTNDVYKKEVEIDDKTYFITGIESFAIWKDHDPVKGYLYKAGRPIGLLIRGDK